MARIAQAVTCSSEEERILNDIANSRTGSFSEVLRAKIILCCLQGMPLSHIAEKLHVSLTVEISESTIPKEALKYWLNIG